MVGYKYFFLRRSGIHLKPYRDRGMPPCHWWIFHFTISFSCTRSAFSPHSTQINTLLCVGNAGAGPPDRCHHFGAGVYVLGQFGQNPGVTWDGLERFLTRDGWIMLLHLYTTLVHDTTRDNVPYPVTAWLSWCSVGHILDTDFTVRHLWLGYEWHEGTIPWLEIDCR